ncbi:hypothetical protein [Angelakisella massiliensis]|uniref:hypothetical protein n=1 Tax=Angelakisella massiliensis TaxID=1871018 RepID=UPI001113B8D9|nr:hypothetical protein [Angelakisella massiliensis]
MDPQKPASALTNAFSQKRKADPKGKKQQPGQFSTALQRTGGRNGLKFPGPLRQKKRGEQHGTQTN